MAAALLAARQVFYLALPLLILAAGIGGYLLATRSLAPLGWMAEQARQITDRSLHKRLDIGDASEELAALSASFNELLARLDQSFDTMRRFVADASHELRTPLSAIRGEADVALALDRSPAEYRESLAIIQDEARRLSRLVEDLLNLARADAGKVRLRVRGVLSERPAGRVLPFGPATRRRQECCHRMPLRARTSSSAATRNCFAAWF